MSAGEILLTAFIALLVFGPERLPKLARHLGAFIKKINRYKQLAQQWLTEQSDLQQLDENIKKAKAADEKYTIN